MRTLLVYLAALAVAAPTWAANPGDNTPRSSSDFVHAQAVNYSSQMMSFLSHIDQKYVRQVSKAKLVEAALEGLYQVARIPMPAGLSGDLAQATEPKDFAYILMTARERLGDLEALRDQKAIYASLRTLPNALDPFSGLEAPDDHRLGDRDQLTGVGIKFEKDPVDLNEPEQERFTTPPKQNDQWTKHVGPVRVAYVYPGSPAQRAGIRPGDVLSQIQDFPLETPGGLQLYPRLFDQSDGVTQTLKLTFERAGLDHPIHCELKLSEFVPETVFGVRRRIDNSWDFMLDQKRRIGYLRLDYIEQTSDKEMTEAIEQLKAEGMRALIFDLRTCPGGYVTPAQTISGMFIKSGLVAKVTDRERGETKYQVDNGSGILEGIPTIALIDGETRGGGEMVAAVLQDYKVARIAGQRSFGKGSTQTRLTASEVGIPFLLTTGSFTRPSGKNLHRFPDSRPDDDWGIRPDPGLAFAVSPNLSKQLKQWMKEQVLRPGDGRQPLPLDDPDNDPLREFARAQLIKQLESITQAKNIR
jgi:C-terminal peptidase prc